MTGSVEGPLDAAWLGWIARAARLAGVDLVAARRDPAGWRPCCIAEAGEGAGWIRIVQRPGCGGLRAWVEVGAGEVVVGTLAAIGGPLAERRWCAVLVEAIVLDTWEAAAAK